ncbi:MAG: exostosin family protein [Paracoccaceae bacterium]|nr:exostosin family protein [Paracoccaceae bacterium]
MDLDFYLSHEREGDRLAEAGRLVEASAAYAQALVLNPRASWIATKQKRLGRIEAARRPETAPNAINLFLPYYTPKDRDRADELRHCLERNLDSGLFARIILLVDDDTALLRPDRRLSILRLDRRPTYLDWVQESRRRCPGQISILANSDIYFDDSVGLLLDLFEHQPDAFVALSRFDKAGDVFTPHSDPHWSQDTWAFLPREDDDGMHDKQFDIPLGAPRCDNKIAYVFATQGYSVFNPFPYIRSIHVHETNLRYYSKKGDRRVIGGMAMVHPGNALFDPAKLDIEVWSQRSEQMTGVRLNRTLENWAEEARQAAAPRPRWLAHDADWQYPAITEHHAFQRMRALLTDQPQITQTVYLGFPFATLVDLHTQRGPSHPRTKAMQEALDRLTPQLKQYERVVTVAQHIRSKECCNIFANAGVTDLFWSHRATGETTFPGHPNMRVHPFPLYPVQQAPRGAEDFDRPRKYLFSFVGARAPAHYMTEARNHIIDLLADDPRGKVVGRDGWHYEKVVYEAQVYEKVSAAAQGLVNDDHSKDFSAVMDDTIFALCPSGSGPNSIRLWEAMLNGAIPVILSDTWAAPGDPALWEAASLRCEETPGAIAALPDRLAAIAAEPGRLKDMRAALLEVARRYGPDGFVADVIELFGGGAV